ncbi:MAG: phenylacetate--CoA ligase [Planctomycetota bacterium]|jgi:phenylacetate-CoA ligase|nr:phenylacetate--CoA ligase [Planctomycetota bacterium]
MKNRKAPFEDRIFDLDECLPRERLAALQIDRLNRTLDRARHVPFYADRLKRVGAIKSLDDVKRLPLTTKLDLRGGYPLDFMAIRRDEIARIHGSSGTTGKMTFVPYSRRDMESWRNLCARFLSAGGLRPGHLVQICFGYGLFTGGFGLHYGVEHLGAAVIPAGAGNSERQLAILRDIKPDAVVCTPGYALNLAEILQAEGVDPSELNVKFGFFGSEPWTDEMRARIEDELGIFATDNYGLSEVIGPGVSGECPWRDGMHVSEDHFLVECIDPETLEPVAPGEKGELVITTLAKEGMPVIRYRTRDISSLDPEPCPCGRTGVRMSRVTGRSDDMMIIRGVNVYPTQIEEALLRIREAAPHYEVELTRPGALDVATVRVEMLPGMFSASMKEMVELRERIMSAISSVTGIRMEVELVAPQSLQRFLGKAKRVTDLRFKEEPKP